MSAHVTVHTGFMGSQDVVDVDWYDHDNITLQGLHRDPHRAAGQAAHAERADQRTNRVSAQQRRGVISMKRCPYRSCPQCGGCGVCQDFHGDVYGGCKEDTCPYRWYHAVRDWLRRLRGPFSPPWVLVLLLLAAPANAADRKKIADVASYGAVAAQLTLDSVHSWRSPHRRTELKQEAWRVGLTVSISEIVKRLVHEKRPDGSDDKSFFSEHTALAASAQGWKLEIGIPLTGGTAVGRVVARKHYVWDVLVGAGVGTLVERCVR